MSDNPRIKDLGNGLQSEAIATDIHLRYDPATGDASVDFHYQDFVTVNGGTVTLPYSGAWDLIVQPLSVLATRHVGAGVVDPITGLSYNGATGLGLMAIFKALADTFYRERAALADSSVPVAPDGTVPDAVDHSGGG